MKKTSGVLLAISLVGGLFSASAMAESGIKCQLPAGKSCVCVASDSTKCQDKYKDVFSCTPNQDTSGKKECEKK